MWKIYGECAKLGISNSPPANWWDCTLLRIKGVKAHMHAHMHARTHTRTHACMHAQEQGGMAIEKQAETSAARKRSAAKDLEPQTWARIEAYSCTPAIREFGLFKLNGSLVGLAKDRDLCKPVEPMEGVMYPVMGFSHVHPRRGCDPLPPPPHPPHPRHCKLPDTDLPSDHC